MSPGASSPSSSPEPGGWGTPLPPNRTTAVVIGVVAVIGWIPLQGALRGVFTADETSRFVLALLASAVTFLLFVLAPLVVIGFIFRRRTWSDDVAVTWTNAGRVERRVTFADLDQVLAQPGGSGLMRPRSLTLVGTDATGADQVVHVSRALVASMQPLVSRVAEEVSRRPHLVDPAMRSAFDEVVGRES